jgi:hypothetical protein
VRNNEIFQISQNLSENKDLLFQRGSIVLFLLIDQELGPFPHPSAIQLKISSGDGFCYLSPTFILEWVF